MNFNRYFSNDELEAQIMEWEGAFGDILQVVTLGKSQEGKDIHLLIVTNQNSGQDVDKPGIWLDANIHSTEIAGTTVALRVAWELLSQYDQDDQITRLIDASTFYIVPRLNPDGAELAMGDIPVFTRSGTRPYPFEEREDGLHIQDIDRDGRILQMRIPDPNGDWKISSANSLLMEKRGADEHGGDYYRLLPEGALDDFDGYIIKVARPHAGLDLNRNYPAEWRPESDQRGAGPYPASEPEIRAAVDFITSHPNINFGVAYHTFGGVILRPYGTKADQEMDHNDLWVFEAIGARAEELTGYRTVSVFHDFKYHPKQIITGPSNDWLYDHLGIYGYVIELWDLVGRATDKYDRKQIEWMRSHPHEDDVAIFEWAQSNGPEDGYVEWYPYEHPQLGAVELGGWNRMYTWRNPPHAFMAEEAQRNVPYILSLAETLPRLSVHTIKVTPIGLDTYRLVLVVENSGFLPTYTSYQAKDRGIRPVRVELSLPKGTDLIEGKARTEIGHLEGRSNKLAAFSFAVPGTDNRGKASWVIQGKAGDLIQVEVISDRAGRIAETVKLG